MKNKTVSAKSAASTSTRKPRAKKFSAEQEAGLSAAELSGKTPRKARKVVVKVQREDPFGETSAATFEPTVVEPTIENELAAIAALAQIADAAEAKAISLSELGETELGKANAASWSDALPAIKDVETLAGEFADPLAADPDAIGTQAWAAVQARQLLGSEAVVWSATHDAKGNAYKVEQFRVGVPTAETKTWEKVGDNWFAIEAGKSIRGTGASYSAAITHARKRAGVEAAA